MIVVPSIQQEGVDAANLGTHMSAREHPLGFTFCPHRNGSAERYNFMQGCVRAYFEGEGERMRVESA